MAAAYRLQNAGHEVTVFDAGDRICAPDLDGNVQNQAR
ncbi:hypothetical protein BRC88_08745 [Halobacteriales archaeon QS_4_69_225]|nr:MAG: hypothetical protein BRC88_08745 [Halobacteriales archaeon QS_4_69_225]